MGRFFVYDGTAGTAGARLILRSGTCPDGQESLQAVDPNDVVVTGSFVAPDDPEQEIV